MNKSIRLTGRDTELLATLFAHRALQADHFVGLGLFGSRIRCNARLRQLRQAGLVRRVVIATAAGSPRIHQASPPAAALIAHRLGLEVEAVRRLCQRPLSLFQVEHALQIANFGLAMSQAAARSGCPATWQPELLCHHSYSVRRGDKWQRQVVKPDGFVKLGPANQADSFFVEIDLGHVSRGRFQDKIASYRTYSEGIFQQTYRAEAFTVLVVTTGQRRLRHLISLIGLPDPPFLFTTFERIKSSGIGGPIWQRPATNELIALDFEGRGIR